MQIMKTRRKFGLNKRMDNYRTNKDNIIKYLENGCKPYDMPLHFGVELEHFVVKKDTSKRTNS